MRWFSQIRHSLTGEAAAASSPQAIPVEAPKVTFAAMPQIERHLTSRQRLAFIDELGAHLPDQHGKFSISYPNSCDECADFASELTKAAEEGGLIVDRSAAAWEPHRALRGVRLVVRSVAEMPRGARVLGLALKAADIDFEHWQDGDLEKDAFHLYVSRRKR
jgi:hypothetical protein